jgi:hypothetical protein
MFNFYFEDDETRHICELQLVHSQMYTVRKEMGAHKTHSTFRAALELLEMLDLDPEIGSDAETLEILEALVWKDVAGNRKGSVAKMESKVQSEALRREVKELRDRVKEQDGKIASLHAKFATFEARVLKLDSVQGPTPTALTLS